MAFISIVTKRRKEKVIILCQSNLTTRTGIFLLIAVIIGAAIGYVSALQTTTGQIEYLQNQITQLQSNQPSGNIVVKGSDNLLAS